MKKSITGERIKQLRQSKGLTLKGLAEATGLSMSAISNYEYGFRQPNAKAMVAFENFFNVTGSYLTGETDIIEPQYCYEDAEIISEKIRGLPSLFGKITDGIKECSPEEQNLLFDILLELRHIVNLKDADAIKRAETLSFILDNIARSNKLIKALDTPSVNSSEK